MAGVVASETVRAQTLHVLRLRLSLRSLKGKVISRSRRIYSDAPRVRDNRRFCLILSTADRPMHVWGCDITHDQVRGL